jgi:hypothetical protein
VSTGARKPALAVDSTCSPRRLRKGRCLREADFRDNALFVGLETSPAKVIVRFSPPNKKLGGPPSIAESSSAVSDQRPTNRHQLSGRGLAC